MTLDLLGSIPEGAGALGLLSSDEWTRQTAAFDEAMIAASGPRVGLLLCADHRNAEGNLRQARAHFGRLGASATRVNHDGPLLDDLDLLFIGGGSPLDLLDCLLNRPVGAQILQRWRTGLAVAGSSAGAMVLSEHCLVPDPGADKPSAWSRGLGPLTSVGMAVHASSRPKSWLEQVVATAPVPVLALDDATGVILGKNHAPTVVGTGVAKIYRPNVG